MPVLPAAALRRSFVLSAVLGMASIASALPTASQAQTFESRTGYPLPQAGAYFDTREPGVGFLFDVGVDGTVFGALMTYEPNGRATFFTVQGKLDRASLPANRPDALAMLRSKMYASRDGQCPGCPWRAPQTSPGFSQPEATLLFTSTRHVEVTIGDFRASMDRVINETDEIDPAGDFVMLLNEQRGGSTAFRFGTDVAVIPIARTEVLTGPDGACGLSSERAAAMHELLCGGANCAAFSAWVGDPDNRMLLMPSLDNGVYTLARVSQREGQWRVRDDQTRYSLHIGEHTITASPRPRECAPSDDRRIALKMLRNPAPLTDTGEDPLAQLSPLASGAYLDPEQPGTGLFIDRSRRDTVFGSWFFYDASGAPTFRVFQGDLASSGSVNIVAGLSAPIMRATGGRCLTCPTSRVTIEPDTAMGRIEILTTTGTGNGFVMRQVPADATPLAFAVDPATRRLDLQRLPLDRTGDDFVRDRWLLEVDDLFANVDSSGSVGDVIDRQQVRAIVSIEPQRRLNGTSTWRVRCVSSCADYDLWRGNSPGVGPRNNQTVELHFDADAGERDWNEARLTVSDVPDAAPQEIGSREYRINLRDRDFLRSEQAEVRLNDVASQRLRQLGHLYLTRNPPDALGN